MQQTIIHVGLDVDDTQYHGSALDKRTGDVIAPTSIPSPRGRQVKTDRIDAAQLAQFYANDQLTYVSIPELEQEQDRDLLRSRQKLLDQQTELRKHLQALLRRNGRHFKAETHHKTHRTFSCVRPS